MFDSDKFLARHLSQSQSTSTKLHSPRS